MLQVNNLSKSFDDVDVLKNLNMHIEKGCVYGLVGPNGAGKSTLIRHLTGILAPDAGQVLIDDVPVLENAAAKAKIGYIPDDIFYFPQANTLDMMRFYKEMYPNFDEQFFYKYVSASQCLH